MSTDPVFDKLFLSIGAMKAGTTWVWDALRQHPGLHICPEKEIHYFYAQHVRPGLLSDRARMRRARSYLSFDAESTECAPLERHVRWVADWIGGPIGDAWFNRLFDGKPPEAWMCDFSNMAALIPAQGWREIAARTRTLRILYCLREPTSRLWSHVRFHMMLHGKSDLLDQWSVDEIMEHIEHPGTDYLAHTDYVANIRALRAALPGDAVHITFFDRIATDPQGYIDGIRAHLGLGPAPLPDRLLGTAINVSPTRPIPPALAERLAPFAARQAQGLRDLGLAVPDCWDRAAPAPPRMPGG